MLFAVDIGNSNIVVAISDGENWVEHWRIHTEQKKTSDEYFLELNEIRRSFDRDIFIDKAIISSVVPSLNLVFEKVCYRLFNIKPTVVDLTIKTNLDNDSIPSEIGSDILANLVAAHDLFPNETVTVLDFGTAFTTSTVDEKGKVLGVTIAPGLVTSVRALANNTAQVPTVELKAPSTVLGRNTMQSVRAGILFGFAGMANELIKKIEAELNKKVRVVVTGGLSLTIAPLLYKCDQVEKNHTLNGLKILASLN